MGGEGRGPRAGTSGGVRPPVMSPRPPEFRPSAFVLLILREAVYEVAMFFLGAVLAFSLAFLLLGASQP